VKTPFCWSLPEFFDHRGSLKIINLSEQFFRNLPISQVIISDNKKGTLRGFHNQRPPFCQTKLVVVLDGKIKDVVVDLDNLNENRPRISEFFLDAGDKNVLYIPASYAHAFQAVEDSKVMYLISGKYNPEAERGFHPLSHTLGISWPVAPILMSDKDEALSIFE